MAGYTSAGFERKRFDEILSDKNEAQKLVFGPEINLAPQSPDGQISGLCSLSDDQLWQVAEYAVNATDPDNATGHTLSKLVEINFIERLGDAATRLIIHCTGTPGVTIAAGQIVGEEDGSLTATTISAFTFSSAGTADVVALLDVTGPQEIPAATMRDIRTPQAGWISADNPSNGIPGRNRETDAELRLRRVRSIGTNSQNLIDSLIGRLGNLEGVSHANVIQNRGDVIDANGLTPHSFEAIVVGGESNAIAQTIWETFPFGIGINGTSTGNAIDKQLVIQPVPFTRAVAVPVYAEVELKKASNYPGDGDQRIKDAIVSYSKGTLVSGRGFFVGDKVVYTELYTPVNSVPGQEIISLKIGRAAGSVAEANLDMTIREYSDFSAAHIVITGV